MITRLSTPVFLIVVTLGILSAGCPQQPPEVTARDVIVGSKSVLDSARKVHPECVSTNTTGICGTINQAVGAKDLAIDALEAYCASPAFDQQGGACTPPTAGSPAATQALSKLTSAVTNLNTIITDLKKAQGGS